MRQPRQPSGSPPGSRAGSGVTRRSFLQTGAAAFGALTGGNLLQGAVVQAVPPSAQAGFLDLLRAPDSVAAYGRFEKTVPVDRFALEKKGNEWSGGAAGSRVVVESIINHETLFFTLEARSKPLVLVHARWQTRVPPRLRVLGDAWERSYGELGWRDLIPERVMPWYFATHDGLRCHAYGVKTDAASLCFWQLDTEGVSLWMNVANGGNGVELGPRRITLAQVISRRGSEGETAMQAVSGFCRQMCARPSRAMVPIYGANDWNYSYGHSTAQSILRDTDFIVSLSPSGGARPFIVIDDGYHDGTAAWPDMGKLAATIRQRQARPGLWVRPLIAPQNAATGLLLPAARFGEKKDRARDLAYDPTVPEAQQKISAKIKQIRDWDYEMVKHDFSTYDLMGQWGFEMGPLPTLPGWSLYDRTRTNAEVVSSLYAMLRQAAGELALLDGCNTVGHLGQGIFDLQRTGDDTSGRQWERTRRMGVNTLAFRLPQHGTFFVADPDIVGITDAIPWSFNEQWLDVLARSGAATIVAPGPAAYAPAQKQAIRAAFQVAAAGGLAARPLDWLENSAPEHWKANSGGEEKQYNWNGPEGASPYLGP